MKRNTMIKMMCFVSVLLFLITGVTFGNGEQEEGGKVTISFWHHYNAESSEHEILTETLIPEFHRQFPDINIDTASHEWAELHNKVLVSASSNQLPDVVRADSAWVPEFQALGILVPISEEMSDFDQVAADILEGPMNTARIDGVYYALGLNTNSKILFYNTALMREAGLQPPETLEDFYQAARKLTQKKGGKQIWGYAEPALSGWNMCPFIWSNGGSLTNSARSKANGYLDSKSNIRVISELVELYEDGAMVGFTAGSIPMTDGFAQGRYAMLIDGPWKFAELKGGHSDFTNYSAVLFPEGSVGSIQVLGGEDIAMFKGASKKQAWDFMKFMTGTFAQIAMAKAGQIPVNTKAVDSQEVRSIPDLDLFLDAIKTANARPALAVWPKMDGILSDAIMSAMLAEKSVSKALTDAAKEMDALLKE